MRFAEDREKTIQFEMNYCQNYDPIPGGKFNASWCKKKCPAVDERIPSPSAGVFGQPCMYGHLLEDPVAVCPSWVRKTREMGEMRADVLEKALQQMEIVGPTVRVWINSPGPKGKQETIECPVCKGKLHLSRSGYNGHVHGHCETEDCVSWME